jgi:hypothetical protein
MRHRGDPFYPASEAELKIFVRFFFGEVRCAEKCVGSCSGPEILSDDPFVDHFFQMKPIKHEAQTIARAKYFQRIYGREVVGKLYANIQAAKLSAC